ncbi:MAG TPA: mannitol dehydrogenase family protein [Caulobacteraceae bacterium]|nr:mannitol dehydrogenase family protein [Caulobacteraceae bacterium]
MTRLNLSTLAQAPGTIGRPDYDIGVVRIGVVHFGPGAFFRAHQCAYIDRLLAQDPRWGICAVSMHSSGVRDALEPQDGLFTLAELDAQSSLRVIGSIRELLVAPERPADVLARLASPDVRLVTLTVTEKGYALTPAGALDVQDPAVRHDLDNPLATPQSVVGWLAAGLKARRTAGLEPFVTLSCDNLSDNGGVLGRAVTAFAQAGGQNDLADWIARQARFPRTMVDSITPATDAPLRLRVSVALGLQDAWPIQREAFTQWVIEDCLGRDAPDLAAAGATLTSDVSLFEQAKLRLLNGAHSTLAYVGLLAGLETVAEAMAEPTLAEFAATLMREDIAPTLRSGAGLDLEAYSSAVLARFANPALRHELAQIAWDGSKKLPVRLLGTIEDARASERSVDRLAIPIAAWMLFVRRQIESGRTLVDPMAALLATCVTGEIEGDIQRFLDLSGVFPATLARSKRFRDALKAAHLALRTDPLKALR